MRLAEHARGHRADAASAVISPRPSSDRARRAAHRTRPLASATPRAYGRRAPTGPSTMAPRAAPDRGGAHTTLDVPRGTNPHTARPERGHNNCAGAFPRKRARDIDAPRTVEIPTTQMWDLGPSDCHGTR